MYLRLIQPKSVLRSNQCPAGTFALIGDNGENLGSAGRDLLVSVLGVRNCAVRYLNEEIVEASIDAHSSVYEDIKYEAAQLGSKSAYGVQLLLYVHHHGLATYFANSKTSRRVIEQFLICWNTNPKNVFRLTSEASTSTKFDWYLPKLDGTEFLWSAVDKYLDTVHSNLERFSNGSDILPAIPSETRTALDKIIGEVSEKFDDLDAKTVRESRKYLYAGLKTAMSTTKSM